MDGAQCQRIVVEPVLLTQLIAGERVLCQFLDPLATSKTGGVCVILASPAETLSHVLVAEILC